MDAGEVARATDAPHINTLIRRWLKRPLELEDPTYLGYGAIFTCQRCAQQWVRGVPCCADPLPVFVGRWAR